MLAHVAHCEEEDSALALVLLPTGKAADNNIYDDNLIISTSIYDFCFKIAILEVSRQSGPSQTCETYILGLLFYP